MVKIMFICEKLRKKWSAYATCMPRIGESIRVTECGHTYKYVVVNVETVICGDISSMDGRLRSTSGCPSARRLLDVYGESETPSTSGEGEHKFTESLPEVKIVEYVVYIKPVRHGADAAGASKKEKKENTKVDIAAAATA